MSRTLRSAITLRVSRKHFGREFGGETERKKVESQKKNVCERKKRRVGFVLFFGRDVCVFFFFKSRGNCYLSRRVNGDIVLQDGLIRTRSDGFVGGPVPGENENLPRIFRYFTSRIQFSARPTTKKLRFRLK